MYQTIFYIPAKLAGYPVFGPGLLLAVWAVASAAIMAYMVWRKGFCADTWGYLPILLLLGAVIRWVLPAISQPQGLPIRGYGMMIMLAVIAGTSFAAWRAKRVGLDPDLMFSAIFWLLVPGNYRRAAVFSSSTSGRLSMRRSTTTAAWGRWWATC